MVADGRRLKTTIVHKTAVEQASAFLQELPEKLRETLSLREAVDQLRDRIKAALSKGYSYEDLAKTLTEKGVEISASTLKNYVPSGKRQAAKDQLSPTKTKRVKKTQNSDSAAFSEDEATVNKIEQSIEPSLSDSPQEDQLKTDKTKSNSQPAEAQEAAATPTKPRRGRAATAPEKSGTRTKSNSGAKTRQANSGRSRSTFEAETPTATKARSTRGRKKSKAE